MRKWNVDNGGNNGTFNSGSDFLYAVSASPDGAVVATGGQDGVVRVFNGSSMALIKALAPPGTETAAPKK